VANKGAKRPILTSDIYTAEYHRSPVTSRLDLDLDDNKKRCKIINNKESDVECTLNIHCIYFLLTEWKSNILPLAFVPAKQ
jgi:hypothetical protein